MTHERWEEVKILSTFQLPSYYCLGVICDMWHLTSDLENPFFCELCSFWHWLYDITMLFTEHLHILHLLQPMNMTFLKLFLIRMIKNSNLADIFTNFAEYQKKKVELRGVLGVYFFQVCLTCDTWHLKPDMWHMKI